LVGVSTHKTERKKERKKEKEVQLWGPQVLSDEVGVSGLKKETCDTHYQFQ